MKTALILVLSISSTFLWSQDGSINKLNLVVDGKYSYLTNYEDSRNLAYNVLLTYNYLLNDNLALSVGTGYDTFTGKSEEKNENATINKIDIEGRQILIPVGVEYQFNKLLSVAVHFNLGYAFSYKASYEVGSRVLSDFGVIDDSYILKDEFAPWTFGLSGGLGINLGSGWKASFTYYHGLNSVYNDQSETLILKSFDSIKDDLISSIGESEVNLQRESLISFKNYSFALGLSKTLYSF